MCSKTLSRLSGRLESAIARLIHLWWKTHGGYLVASSVNRELFEADAAVFLEKAIKENAARSPGNRFESFDGGRIFDEPLVGFADGDDAIFQDYKMIIDRKSTRLNSSHGYI